MAMIGIWLLLLYPLEVLVRLPSCCDTTVNRINVVAISASVPMSGMAKCVMVDQHCETVIAMASVAMGGRGTDV